jgi:hypothetical protein
MSQLDGLPADDALRMWTLYEKPADYPDAFVLREWVITGGGAVPMRGTFVASKLETLQGMMADKGLTFIPRDPRDPPHILGVYL